ncbi:amyotrophic lateral sclerosis 2 isoform X3 [Rhynchophorus ferrugineus]|uniref:amyotrophic lateral sclerosis 2 isoform X3 n=1 Tax=Rhynchophorus ferrugineus TaxID=354439 RepID=UPI003FCD945E
MGMWLYASGIGSDSAAILVAKKNFTIKDNSDDEIFMSKCPSCFTTSLATTPDSQDLSKEICPLGIKLKSNTSCDTLYSDSGAENEVCVSETHVSQDTQIKAEKNIIFRNTEAAKDFLSRQISRMSSVGEEYLIECTEKPTKLIKENVSSMASFVFEGVKTVGDKVATLSRHVSASSEYSGELDNNNETIQSKHSIKEDLTASGSQSTSERDLSEAEVYDRLESVLEIGSELLNREVWCWGNIVSRLIGGNGIKKDIPVIIPSLSNNGVCKISLQNHHACAITLDGRAYIWGQNNFNQVSLEKSIDQPFPKLFTHKQDERILDGICGTQYTVILTNKGTATYFGKGVNYYQNLFCGLTPTQIDETNMVTRPFRNLISSNQYTLLNLGPKYNDYFSNFLHNEQIHLEELIQVYRDVVKIILKKIGNSRNNILYESFCKYYVDLLYFHCINTHSLLECRNGIGSPNNIVILKYYTEFISVNKNYFNVVQNITTINGFEKKVAEMLQNKNEGDNNLPTVLVSPAKRMSVYTEFYTHYLNSEALNKWKHFIEDMDSKVKEAEKTRLFWLNAGKNINQLMTPERRLIYDSLTDPIALFNSSRFSSHRFVLFSDILAHVSGSSHYSCHNLSMVWLDLPPHNDLHLINLVMPEDTLTLVAHNDISRNNWFHILQKSIRLALNKEDVPHTPIARNGIYTFTKPGFLKDATYNGRWLNAKMQGKGKLMWTNGKIYIGSFNNNVICGYGTMDIPNEGFYEGQWKDNKPNGYGIFTYSNGDIYKGYFKDGMRHGHGFLRKGSFTANSASVYVGQWISDQKSGYGVLDDISIGQKYIGSWVDDKKEGNGLIVTFDGIYYEGRFHSDVLQGHGTMILEDGSFYEGEFKGIGIIGGKGSLTLPSGHVLEGFLSGSLETGLRINNGVLKKTIESCRCGSGKFCTPPSQKWTSLFEHCHEALGLKKGEVFTERAETPETTKIWQNVAVYLSNASTLKRSKGDEGFIQNSLNNLDVIPPFGRDLLGAESYQEVKGYLTRAFENTCHPLGSLLSGLSEAYITCYSGKNHSVLVNQAIIEIIDLTQRVYRIVRYLFPALPSCDTNERLSYNGKKDESITYQSLLYPIFLPKVYNCLFTLLILKNDAQEKEYKKSLKEWNKLSDRALMSILSVDKKFFDLDYSVVSSDNACAFAEAIETLQQIKSMFLPIEKLIVIRNTVDKMTPVAQTLIGNNYLWNMDDLLPLFLFVVVRSRIPDLGAELEFIENFMDSVIENGELGIMFTTLKACYQHLQDKSVYF